MSDLPQIAGDFGGVEVAMLHLPIGDVTETAEDDRRGGGDGGATCEGLMRRTGLLNRKRPRSWSSKLAPGATAAKSSVIFFSVCSIA